MITLDSNDSQPWRDHLEEIHREADRKLHEKLPLTPDEEAVIGGSHDIRFLMTEGYEKFEAQAWSDAIFYYHHLFSA